MRPPIRSPALIALTVVLTVASVAALAQVRRPRPFARRHARQARQSPSSWSLPPGVRMLRDLHYGASARRTFDVYLPAHAHAAPVIFLVHGGGWWRGDKAAAGVVRNKVAHWVPRGFIVVSVDYPLVPHVTPLQEAQAVSRALATAQHDAPQWGGNPRAFVLMGHSAGAQLVSLISAEPRLATADGALPWRGTVALDSAAYDVVGVMERKHFPLYDTAFGTSRAAWRADSPIRQLTTKIAPFLAVCSSLRADSCRQARAFAAKARRYGTRVKVLPEALRHGPINQTLGLSSGYTAAVDAFLASLGPAWAARLR